MVNHLNRTICQRCQRIDTSDCKSYPRYLDAAAGVVRVGIKGPVDLSSSPFLFNSPPLFLI
jgi:hypothetical protein